MSEADINAGAAPHINLIAFLEREVGARYT
jgi:hypothetical protein